MQITLDIETLPTANHAVIADITEQVNEKIGKEIAAIRAPGNYGAEAAAKWLIEKGQPAIDALKASAAAEIDQAVRKTGLDGSFGRVCVVGIAVNDEPPQMLFSDTDEKSVLIALNSALTKAVVGNEFTCTFIGHNIVSFDLRFLVQRFIVNGIRPCVSLARASQAKPWDADKVYDTMTQWAGNGGRISLDRLCRALSIESPKGDITGATVYDAVLAGRIHNVAEYCERDIEATREVFKRMTFQ
jgi:hypothetical protein